ncbi:hypothetical protein MSAN_01606400 [Mycena sanguinolenta]|uniref:LysM domain-containing protein n=1 Tax=Mycena sanguinolenta TaxID=230812 RepID=A0A8H7CXF1_9AGAR|nr:hypothetical protein MSAN_01606400 [Mycena sanguinolenta]
MLFKTFAALLVTALSVSATPLEARQSCTSSYTVVGGDTCNAIAAKTGVSTATIFSLNPSINSGCTNLQIGQVLCLSTGGGGGGISGIGGCPHFLLHYQHKFNPAPVVQRPFTTLTAGSAHAATFCRTASLSLRSAQTTGMAARTAARRLLSNVYEGRSVQVVVQDFCPGCQGSNGIDLTEPPMQILDPNYIFDGKINVVWNFD